MQKNLIQSPYKGLLNYQEKGQADLNKNLSDSDWLNIRKSLANTPRIFNISFQVLKCLYAGIIHYSDSTILIKLGVKCARRFAVSLDHSHIPGRAAYLYWKDVVNKIIQM